VRPTCRPALATRNLASWSVARLGLSLGVGLIPMLLWSTLVVNLFAARQGGRPISLRPERLTKTGQAVASIAAEHAGHFGVCCVLDVKSEKGRSRRGTSRSVTT